MSYGKRINLLCLSPVILNELRNVYIFEINIVISFQRFFSDKLITIIYLLSSIYNQPGTLTIQ